MGWDDWSDADLEAYAQDCERRRLTSGPFAAPEEPVLLDNTDGDAFALAAK